MPDALPPLSAEVVVVGAGPGGLAAAQAAARTGARVIVVDAAPLAGGQVWRARRGVAEPGVAKALRTLEAAAAQVLSGTRVALALPGRALLVEGPEGARVLHWRRLVLATGARERLLPFPGWTLPGVFGAGGLQALAKGGWPIAGKRVVVAGTGPLLLAAAASLRREGAHLVAIVEEAPWQALARFAPALLRRPRKLSAALRLAGELRGVPWLHGWRLREALGDTHVTGVTIASNENGNRMFACDALAAGWGLVPQVELAEALGCAMATGALGRAIVTDSVQRSSVEGVFAVGECTGIAGVRSAVLQGQLAGAAAAGAAVDGAAGRAAMASERGFAAAVARAFPVPGDWAARLTDDTLVCRCEDVRWGALRAQADLRAAKLATRCGMGHCQGRLCHDALAPMMSAERLPARLPTQPVSLGALLAMDVGGDTGTDSRDVPLSTEESS